jgi:riboflavin kinase / FMN adenylyltransferase
MKVFFGVDALPYFNNTVITTGTFDGVHNGHKMVLQQLKEKASALQTETVVITFYPHPRKVLHTHTNELQLINTLEEKISLLEQAGIDNLVVIAFDETFYNLSAMAYIKHFLVEKFKPAVIIIGYDHKFGNDRSGDVNLLQTEAANYNYEVIKIPEQVCKNIGVSSTKIRKAIADGDMPLAKDFLGYDFFFQGTIVKGKQLGRTIGYPTANLKMPPDKLIPKNGVYAVTVNVLTDAYKNQTFMGMMNIGNRPTVDGTTTNIEVHIFEFDDDIYDRTLKVFAHEYIREEVKFDGLDALKTQLALDKINCQNLLKKYI